MPKKNLSPGTKTPLIVSICGVLLVMEAIEFFLLGVYHFQLNHGPALFSTLFAQWLRGDIPLTITSIDQFLTQLINTADSQQLFVALNESSILFLLTILSLWSAIGFSRLWTVAWSVAMFVQAAALLTSLVLYFVNRPLHITLVMASGILMVLYLNNSELQAFLRFSDQSPSQENKA